MRCLTIRQPWATLIALGEKSFETRSWRTAYRGEIAIHAGLKIDKAVCLREPFQSVLARHGLTADNLPAGVIVATGSLINCYEVTAGMAEEGWPYGSEYIFGDYREGRFAWELTGVTPLEDNIPAKGRLGFWEHPVLQRKR
ncbi:2-oxoglutarate dehydrogenase E1 [Paenibacillus sp. FSL H7-0357]|uniref:ASCH domain-containing protein n=1 Tax=Paenibacillus sp. FSL H7-0357 TaxID=1536774 RepID=UPI0004F741A1|nr:ASCH domain-containing protein [Paenibacillus sp. FSL H7-0357]AIQ15677.1 2-oxoglutarate dehydrogenase E1 [Paenibacillus sp. FSL H7-0357]